MSTFLFDEIVFGPVKSRRLGNSLGINLLPLDCKLCNFNCIYCECGWSGKNPAGKLKSAQEIEIALRDKLMELRSGKTPVDTITFAGNGEPTLHLEFDTIIDFTLRLRNEYFPKARVAVLSNSTMLKNEKIFGSLNKVEMNILKLDSAIESTVKLLNQPSHGFSLKKTLDVMKQFNGNFILQTMFVTGSYGLVQVDNTKDEEIKAWLEVISDLKPKMVMMYTIQRNTPVGTLNPVSKNRLEEISKEVKKLNIEVMISA